MKIGIDARPMQNESKYRGIGRMLENILEYGAAYFNLHDINFYIEKNLPIPPVLEKFPNAKVTIINSGVRTKRFIRAIAGEFKTPTPTNKNEVFFQAEFYLGVPKKVRSVMVFHDAIPLLFKEKEGPIVGNSLRSVKRKAASKVYWNRYVKLLKTYSRATRIIAISNNSKRDLENLILINKKIPVSVVYESSTPLKKIVVEKVSFIDKKERFLLYVGGIDIRKNILGLLDDFNEIHLTHKGLRLICVGKEFLKKDQLNDLGWSKFIKKNNLEKYVITPGYVSDGELSYLYENAEAFVFPSRYEGFGLPVLEAMQSGCPVVAYDNSSIPEVAGNAAILVKDGESMVPALEDLMQDKGKRKALIEKGYKQAEKFSWKRTAQETIKVLEGVGDLKEIKK